MLTRHITEEKHMRGLLIISVLIAMAYLTYINLASSKHQTQTESGQLKPDAVKDDVEKALKAGTERLEKATE